MKWEAYHWAKVPCPSCGHVGIMKHGDSKWSCMVCGARRKHGRYTVPGKSSWRNTPCPAGTLMIFKDTGH